MQVERGGLLRQASPLLVGRAISAVITFTIPILLARRLSVAEYGTYKQFFLIASTTFLVGQIGLPASLYYFVPRGGPSGRYLMQALAGLFACGACAAGIIYFGSGVLAKRLSNPTLASLAAPLACFVWLQLGAATLEISLTSARRTVLAGISYVISDIARCLALLAPIHSGLGMRGLAWGAVGFVALRFIAAWTVALTGAVARPASPSRSTLRAQLAYSIPFAGAVLFGVGQMHFPQYAVAAMTDAATFAVYAVGALQLPMTDVFYSPIAEMMMVKLAQVGPDGASPVFREAVARLVVFFLPLAAFAWAIGPTLIPTMFTTRYAAAVAIFAVAIAEIPLSVLPVDGLLRALDCTRTIFWINAGRLAFTVAAVPLGLWAFGLIGAMAGYIATQTLAKVVMLIASGRRLKIRPHELLPWRELGTWAARSAAIWVALTLLRQHGPWHGWRFLAAASILGLAMWVAALATAGELKRAAQRPSTEPTLG
jgi:O-antigen/teichoic acid export membrane protein